MAVAAAAGAVLALVLMPRFSRPVNTGSRWDSWTPNITRAGSLMISPTTFALRFARGPLRHRVDHPGLRAPGRRAMTRIDHWRSQWSSLVDKASGWFQKAQDKAKEKMG